jgi:AhpD family alkylhydroperoxidase
MTQRLDYLRLGKPLVDKLVGLSMALRKGSLGNRLLDLVNIRVSQINGCAFCVDMHVKEATQHGESELRLHHVAIWRESPLFAPDERAAFAWAEAVTRLGPDGVSDEAYAVVREAFDEAAVVELTFAVMAINAWNRASIAFRNVPGSADAMYGLDKVALRAGTASTAVAQAA